MYRSRCPEDFREDLTMNRICVAILIGSMVASAVPSSAMAFYCVARSTNGVSGQRRSPLESTASRMARVRRCRR